MRQAAAQGSEQKLPDYKTPVYMLDSVPAGLPPPPPPPPPPGRTEKYMYPILWIPGREAHMQPFYQYNEVSGSLCWGDSLTRPALATPIIKTGYWRPAGFGGVDCYCWCNVTVEREAEARVEAGDRRIARLHACAARAVGYYAFFEHVDRTRRGNGGAANSSLEAIADADAEAEAEAEAGEPSDGPEEPANRDEQGVEKDKKGKGKEKCKCPFLRASLKSSIPMGNRMCRDALRKRRCWLIIDTKLLDWSAVSGTHFFVE